MRIHEERIWNGSSKMHQEHQCLSEILMKGLDIPQASGTAQVQRRFFLETLSFGTKIYSPSCFSLPQKGRQEKEGGLAACSMLSRKGSPNNMPPLSSANSMGNRMTPTVLSTHLAHQNRWVVGQMVGKVAGRTRNVFLHQGCQTHPASWTRWMEQLLQAPSVA